MHGQNHIKFAFWCWRTIKIDETERSVKDVIHRIPRKAISRLSQQLAICIETHRLLRQNNEGSRSSHQLCRPFAVFAEENSGILKNTRLTDGAHFYVNGIVNVGNTKPKLSQEAPPNRLHSLASVVYCWYSGSIMQKGQEESEPTDTFMRFNPNMISIEREHQLCAKQSICLLKI